MSSETIIRLGCFLAIFGLVAACEALSPRRALSAPRSGRWFTNLALIVLDPLAVRLVFPVLPVAMSLLAAERHWGLLNHVDLPLWLEGPIALVVLDFSIYLQHVLFHVFPTLWRLHMVHHADLDYDLTTGLRFHPVEIIVSMAIKVATVAALGPPALAVLVFEVAANAMSMFDHANMRIPAAADRVLRLLLVTPDMHRVHHSVVIRETNSNFGVIFPWWDRLLGTYKNQPDRGHEGMTIGLSQFRDLKRLNLPRLLILPFVGDPGGVPINRH